MSAGTKVKVVDTREKSESVADFFVWPQLTCGTLCSSAGDGAQRCLSNVRQVLPPCGAEYDSPEGRGIDELEGSWKAILVFLAQAAT